MSVSLALWNYVITTRSVDEFWIWYILHGFEFHPVRSSDGTLPCHCFEKTTVLICVQGDDIFLDMFEAEYRQMKVRIDFLSFVFVIQ